MTGAATLSDALPLLVWLSPAFPVGGFAFSHGLEAAVEAGLVVDAATLKAWIDDLLAHGSMRQDALLLGAAWDASAALNDPALDEANALALALCASRERRLETTTMGNAFVATLRACWPAATPRALETGDTAYPVALGAASALQGLARREAMAAFLVAAVANLVSAALRLSIIGQTDGQRVTAGLLPAVRALAAASLGLDDLGGCAFRSDLAALQHETQYSRLFRS